MKAVKTSEPTPRTGSRLKRLPIKRDALTKRAALRDRVSTAKRSAFAPDLPTVAESGLPGFNVFGWNGVLATGGTPRPIIEKLHTLFITAMKDADVRKRMADFGFEPIGNSPEEFGTFVKEDIARWALVKETGAKVE